MSAISLRNRQKLWKIQLPLLRRILRCVVEDPLFQPGPPNQVEHQIGFYIISADEMARMNWKYLQHEGPTDVITFDYGSDSAGGRARALEGEVFICPEVAESQAREFGTSFSSELVRYAIHGLLHLRGFDDLKPAARRRMKREEERLLRGVADRFPLSDLGTRLNVSA